MISSPIANLPDAKITIDRAARSLRKPAPGLTNREVSASAESKLRFF
jgi:hypothetical protein